MIEKTPSISQVSWQIVPKKLSKMIAVGTCEQIDYVIQALLPVKKFMISDLEKTDKEH
jgi:predicted 3-demethylubiquinone-9 3-methyltransferase (glyoxalase superfamily)